MATDKRKHAFWLTDAAKEMVEIDAHLDNCGSQSEFVEKAIRFYDGYVHANKTGAYLPHAMQEVLEGTLGVFGDRLGRLLFKLVVEHNITNHLLAEDADMDAEMYRKYRGYSVREVTDTQGAFSFRDALRLHRRQ